MTPLLRFKDFHRAKYSQIPALYLDMSHHMKQYTLTRYQWVIRSMPCWLITPAIKLILRHLRLFCPKYHNHMVLLCYATYNNYMGDKGIKRASTLSFLLITRLYRAWGDLWHITLHFKAIPSLVFDGL